MRQNRLPTSDVLPTRQQAHACSHATKYSETAMSSSLNQSMSVRVVAVHVQSSSSLRQHHGGQSEGAGVAHIKNTNYGNRGVCLPLVVIAAVAVRFGVHPFT